MYNLLPTGEGWRGLQAKPSHARRFPVLKSGPQLVHPNTSVDWIMKVLISLVNLFILELTNERAFERWVTRYKPLKVLCGPGPFLLYSASYACTYHDILPHLRPKAMDLMNLNQKLLTANQNNFSSFRFS